MDCWGIWQQCQNEACHLLQPSFTDHISTRETDGVGSNDWRWTLCERSLASMGIVRMPMNDAMRHPSPKIFLSLNEIIEWGMSAATCGA